MLIVGCCVCIKLLAVTRLRCGGGCSAGGFGLPVVCAVSGSTWATPSNFGVALAIIWVALHAVAGARPTATRNADCLRFDHCSSHGGEGEAGGQLDCSIEHFNFDLFVENPQVI